MRTGSTNACTCIPAFQCAMPTWDRVVAQKHGRKVDTKFCRLLPQVIHEQDLIHVQAKVRPSITGEAQLFLPTPQLTQFRRHHCFHTLNMCHQYLDLRESSRASSISIRTNRSVLLFLKVSKRITVVHKTLVSNIS